MKNTTTNPFNIEKTEKSVKISFEIPFKELPAEDCMTQEQRNAIAYDTLGAFSERIIASLQRRMNACVQKLINHVTSAFVEDTGLMVFYKAKCGYEYFSTPSYEAMRDCIKALQHSCWNSVLTNQSWINQILKALLNDPEQNHEDAGGFKYSQLISLLCECHRYIY